MQIKDFWSAGVALEVKSYPEQGVGIRYQINHHNKVNVNPMPNKLYYVEHATTFLLTQTDKELLSLNLSYIVLLDLEGTKLVSENGNAEGNFVTTMLRPFLFSEINTYLVKARFPLMNYKDYT
jgi:hypothetical protein